MSELVFLEERAARGDSWADSQVSAPEPALCRIEERIVPHIRRAVPADASLIRDLHQQSVRGMSTGDYTHEQIESWVGAREPQMYEQAMAEGEIFYIAALEGHDDEICGFACFFPHLTGDDKHAEIRAVYVDPNFERQGIGSALLEALEEEARLLRLTLLRLNSTATAIPFYLHHGFHELERGHHPNADEMHLECVTMEKNLA